MFGIKFEGKEKGIYNGLKLIINEKDDLFYEISNDHFKNE